MSHRRSALSLAPQPLALSARARIARLESWCRAVQKGRPLLFKLLQALRFFFASGYEGARSRLADLNSVISLYSF